MDKAPPSLIEISPGELIDRLTIAEIRSARQADPVQAAVARREVATLSRAREQAVPAGDPFEQLAKDLRAINQELWQMEDEIRAAVMVDGVARDIGELALRICRANDRRARLKQRINALLGVVAAESKLYRSAMGRR
jgi:hypothetical protein